MQPSPTNDDAQPDAPRLRKGELRALVLEHPQEHSDVEHSPTAVAKTLGRSAGAVSNALDRLAADGVPSRPTRNRAGSPPHAHDQRPSSAQPLRRTRLTGASDGLGQR